MVLIENKATKKTTAEFYAVVFYFQIL